MPNEAFERQKGKGITSTERARELGKQGGVASAKAYKEKKEIKTQLQIAVDLFTKKLSDNALKEGKKELAEEIKAINAINFKLLELINTKNVKPETKLKALTEILDRTEGKPKQESKVEHSGSIAKIIRDDIV